MDEDSWEWQYVEILKKDSKEWELARKFLKRAKQIARDECHCYSRQIGAVIARGNIDLSTGYNGPPMGVSHCENRHPLGRKECPRRYLGYASGQGLHICPAKHA